MPEYDNNVNTISTNVDDYTYAELLLLLNLNDINALNKEAIIESTGKFIKKYTTEDRPKLVTFFENIRKKLIQYAEQIEDGEANVGPQAAQTTQWTADAGALPQDDKQQMDKTTDRFQKIDVYGNDAVPMEREKLGVNNTYDVPVAQDGKLNPKLENTVNDYLGGVRSTCTYIGCDKLEDMPKNTNFIVVSQQANHVFVK